MTTIHQQFGVPFDYPVIFTRDVFRPDEPLFADLLDRLGEQRQHRALCFVDAGVAEQDPGLRDRICRYAETHDQRMALAMEPRIVPGGEIIKNDYRLVMEIVDTILEYRMCRQSYVVVIGGGAVLDAVGFAASIVHRGLRVVRMPTTVLAQNDAGVGVKNGMNLHGGKNTIGTFAPPFAVVNDYAFLPMLRDAEWRSGIAEAFKVAVIKDRAFFERLCAQSSALQARDQDAMEELVFRCAQLHLEHIRSSGDPFETGQARPLDFGHWSAHKLESMSGYEIPHGFAVAAGVALDTRYAMLQGWLAEAEAEAVYKGLEDAGLNLWFDVMGRRLGDGSLELLRGLEDFQEHLGGRLTVTFPRGIGQAREVNEVDTRLMEEALEFLQARVEPAQKQP